MKAPRTVAETLVRIPPDLGNRSDASFQTLLAESGYAHEHDAIDVLMIEEALRGHPEFVGDWLQYSEDKRTSIGWFLRRTESGSWEVGCVNRGALAQVTSYQDGVAACAAFIKKEVEVCRGHG